jgi:hypothetical protein
MDTQTTPAIGPEGTQREPGGGNNRRRTRSGPDTPRTCCGKPMESRLARAHDRTGQTVFAAVWHCPVCERVVFC